MLLRLCLFVLCLVLFGVEGLIGLPKIDILQIPDDADVGRPLFLTPLLEKGEYVKAQNLSKVTLDIGDVRSYSGFFTVNKKCKSNLFFWFFPAQKVNWNDAPLLLWLEGGPGLSSLISIFLVIGPFHFQDEGLQKQNLSWNVENNLLIIDQPVGTGYSFTGEGCYAQNETVVGEDLYQALVQFYKLFPQLKKNNFFIAGESYAGHYIPALGHTIHKHNPTAKVKINLTAMMIGNGLSDAATQLDYGNYLYYLGLIDDAARDVYKENYNKFVQEITKKNWKNAGKICDALLGSLYELYVDHKVYLYNYIRKPFRLKTSWTEYIQSGKVRKALHIGNLQFQRFETVYYNLRSDIVQSVKPWVEELLEVYPIVFYNGQLDILCGYPMMINFLRSLTWSGQTRYLNAARTKWCIGNELAGYYKGVHNLYDLLVRDAGHIVPADQPLWAYALVNSVTSGSPKNPLHALSPCKD